MENTIQSDLIRGHINTIILKALYDGDRYGYDIIREIEQKSSGQYKLKQPTLYSCLKRLEIQGFIRSYWGAKSNGGRRKYFTLTEMGRELFLRSQSEWEYSRTVIDKLISDREVDLNLIAQASSGDALQDEVETESYVQEDEISESEFEQDAESDEGEESSIEVSAEQSEETSEIAETHDSDEDDLSAVEEQEREDIAAEEAVGEDSDVQDDVSVQDEVASSVASPVTFTDTTAIMNALLHRQSGGASDESYADKLETEEYVSDRTDDGLSAESYFRDFLESDAISEQEEQAPSDKTQISDPQYSIWDTPQEEQPVEEQEQPTSESVEEQTQQAESQQFYTDPIPRQSIFPVSEQVDEEAETQQASTEDGFLDYHNTAVAAPSESAVIEREYRNILGDFLNSTFVDTSVPPAEEPKPVEQPQAATTTQQASAPMSSDPITPTPSAQEEYGADSAETENESVAVYTNDADVNRKLTRLTGEVREMGDNVVIRTHNSADSQQYNNTYYYLSNKLMLVHYGIVFGIMMLEILISAVFIHVVLGNQIRSSADTWCYVLSGIVAVMFPIVAFIKYFMQPNKRKRINFSLKNSLIFRSIVTLQCFLIIYCINIMMGMSPAFTNAGEYLVTLLTPALLCTGFPVSALIFNALFKTKKFAAE